MKKRILSLVLALVLVFSLIPTVVIAEDTDSVTYELASSFEFGKTYLIVNTDNGAGKALTNTQNSAFGNADVTVSDNKIIVSEALTTAEWKAKETKTNSGLIGLYNSTTVLKIQYTSNTASIYTSSTSYNSGGFGYTASNHVSYPYNSKDYYIGSDATNGFKASDSETDLGEVYIFVKTSISYDTEVSVEASRVGSTSNGGAVDAVIKVGGTLTINLKNGRTSALTYGIEVEKPAVATVNPVQIENLTGSGTSQITVTGVSAGETKIIISGTASSTYKATVNLTVVGGGTAPEDPPAASTAVYLGFTSDAHNASSDSSATRLNTWLNNVSAALGDITFANFGSCGDMGSAQLSGNSYWNASASVISVVENSAKVDGDGFFVLGNHEWNSSNGNYGDASNTNETKAKYSVAGEKIVTDDYILYSFGAENDSNTFVSDTITALDTYLSNAPTDRPIFILSHFPLHNVTSRSITNKDSVISTLNKYGDTHEIIFVWGHNHSRSDDNHYDKVYTETLDSTPIKFAYCAAGCMSDSDYIYSVSGVYEANGLVAAIDDDGVVLSYYKADGTTVGTPVTITAPEPPATGKTVDITASTSGNTENVTIDVGERLTINLTTGSTTSTKTYTVEVADPTVASASASTITLEKSATGTLTVTGLKDGTTTIVMSASGGGGTYRATINLTVNDPSKQSQTIAAEDVTATYGDTGVAVAATLTVGDGALSYAVTDGDVVTVNAETGALTIIKAGSAVVTVTAAATETYKRTTKEVNITISKAEGVWVAPSTTVAAASGDTLSKVTLPAGYSWKTPSTTVTATGEEFDAVYNPDSTKYTDAEGKIAVTVMSVVALTPAQTTPTTASAEIEVGGSIIFRLTNGGSSKYTYTLKAGTTGVAELSENSVSLESKANTDIIITGLAEGITEITASGGNSTYPRTSILTLTVTDPSKQPQTIAAEDVTATYGDTGATVVATLTVGDGALSYAVTDGDAVTIDAETGALVIVKAGDAVVTVTAAATETYKKTTKDVNITISKAEGVWVAPSTTVAATSGDTLSNVILPTGYSWKDSSARVTTSGEEFDAIYNPDSTKYKDAEGKIAVTVVPAVDITSSTSGATADETIDVGGTLIINLKNGSGSNKTYSATVEDTAIATVTPASVSVGGSATQAFTVTGVSDGTTTVTLKGTSSSGSTYTATINLTVADPSKQPQTIAAEDVTATYGDTGVAVAATLTVGNGALSYAVTDGDAVTVDAETGALTIVKAGSAVVTVTAAATETYKKTTKDVSITIGKATPASGDYTVPTGLTALEGDTLSDVALPTGFSWMDPTTSVGEAGTHTFPAAYTPNGDTVNYNSIENIEVSVKVSGVVYTLTDSLEANKTYLIVNTDSGLGKALTNTSTGSFGTTDVTVNGSKIAFSQALASAEWEAREWSSGKLGLYNGTTALKISAQSTPTITTTANGTYSNGYFSYTSNNHIQYPYGQSPAKDYYIGADDTNVFKASDTEENLGEIYIFVKGVAQENEKIERTITVDDIEATYGDTDAAIEATLSAGEGAFTYAVKEGEDTDVVTVGTDGALTILKAGATVITVTAAETEDYASASADVEVTIGQKEVTLIWSGDPLTYNGEEQAPAVTADGVLTGDTVSVTVTGGKTNAGVGYVATATALTNDNYKLPATNLTKTFDIAKATPAYTAPSGLSVMVGKTLNDIGALPEGFTWEDAANTAITETGDKTFYVTYTPADTDNYTVVTHIGVTVTVTPKNARTITADDIEATYGDTNAAIEATLSAGEGTFTYAVKEGEDTDVVTVGTDGALTILKAGATVITVTAAETEDYASASADVEVTIGQKEVTLIWSGDPLTYNGEEQAPAVTADGVLTGDTVSVTVTGGKTNAGVGYVATATALTNDNYKLPATNLTKTFDIAKATPAYTAPGEYVVTIGKTLNDIGALPEGFTWEEAADAALAETGEKTFHVTYTPADTENYKVVTNIEVKVTVTSKTIRTITADDIEATYGDTDAAIEATLSAGEGTFTYAVKEGEDTDVVTVGTDGALTILKAGATIITVTAAETADYAPAFADIEVTIGQKEVTLIWSGDPLTYNGEEQAPAVTADGVLAGDTVSVTVTGGKTNAGEGYVATATALTNDNYKLPATGLTKTFDIAKATPAYTAPSGLSVMVGKTLNDIGALPEGFTWEDAANTAITETGDKTFYVTYTPADTDNYTVVTHIGVTVTVTPKNARTITVDDIEATYGDTNAAIEATLSAGEGTFTYAVKEGEDTDVVTVGTDGALTILKAGATVITVTAAETEDYASASADVEVTIGQKEVTLIWSGDPLTYNGEEQAPAVTADGVLAGDTVSVTVTGGKTNAGEGYVATATALTNDNYKLPATNLTKTFDIAKATPAYTVPSNLTALVGKTLAAVELPDHFEWEDELTTSVGELGDNKFTVKYVPEDEDNYIVVTGIEVTVKVTAKPAQTITVEDIEVTYGDEAAIEAAVNAGGGALTYAVKEGDDVVEVGTDGTLTLLKGGIATVTVTAAETENYAETSKDVTVTVNKKNITWTAPEGTFTATYGDKLSDVELPANYSWKNAEESVGNATEIGNTFTVVYNPDADIYKDAEGEVTVLVEKAKAVWVAPEGTFTAEYGTSLADVTLPAGYSWKYEQSTTGAVNAEGNGFVAKYNPDPDNLTDVEGTVKVIVTKATPTYVIPDDLTATEGTTLAYVKLPDGFEWQDATASVGEIGTRTFKAFYTPDDTDNYMVVYEIEIPVTIEAAPEPYVPEVINKTKDGGAAFATVEFENNGKIAVVSCDLACVVIAQTGEDEYVRLTAVKRSEGVYVFDLSGLEEGFKLIVALRGDSNMDGFLNSTDLGQARSVMSKRHTPSKLQMLVMDLHVNGVYNSTDLGQLRSMFTGKLVLPW